MQRAVSDSDVIIHLAKLLNKLKANEFRIHPNIIDSAIDSLEDFEEGVKRVVSYSGGL